VQPLPDLIVTFLPDDKGVESLARQIKISGRSFPLFDIAQMILQKPERHLVRIETKSAPEGKPPPQQIFLCAIDDTLWLAEEEAVAHVLEKHFGMFYQAEKSPTEPPKGVYTFVAQCGMSGVVLGPPNYHAYQDRLRKLHAERFSRMPFEAFKARVKIVKDEAVVKKWVEEQSFKTDYVCLNVPEPARLPDREAVEKHFREVHLANIIKSVPKHTLPGATARLLRSPGLQRLIRAAWEDQRRFPLQIATVLSQQFASHGMQFFKVNKTVTHVCVARPHFLDLEATPVSEQVKQIVQFINAKPKCTRRLLIETLAPTPPSPQIIPVIPAAEPAPAPAAEASTAGAATAQPPAAAPANAARTEAEPTPEQAAIIGDLHWLIHQGHVIEFANGVLEMAKKPVVKPPRAPRPEPVTPAPAGEMVATSAEPAVPADPTAPTAEVQPTVEPTPEAAAEPAVSFAPAEPVAPEIVATPAAVSVEPAPAGSPENPPQPQP
jgi:hypothetical protein